MGESYLIVLSGAELLRMRRRRRRRSQERKDQLKSLHRCAAQIVRADRELESVTSAAVTTHHNTSLTHLLNSSSQKVNNLKSRVESDQPVSVLLMKT